MKIKISYYGIQSDHVLAIPKFTHSEIVETEYGFIDPKLTEYISGQKDWDGYKFKKCAKKKFGFDYISKSGGVKVEVYKEPRIKKL